MVRIRTNREIQLITEQVCSNQQTNSSQRGGSKTIVIKDLPVVLRASHQVMLTF